VTADQPPVDPASASEFTHASGFVPAEMSGTRVTGVVELGPQHHTPWGVVHGGVYCSVVESAASMGASAAVADRGEFSVGVHNATDFLRPMTAGRLDVLAEPVQQGRTQQLWLVSLTRAEDGKLVARGQVRLQNVPLPGA
jgi:uncharacterized protein (TIGR00369 family)